MALLPFASDSRWSPGPAATVQWLRHHFEPKTSTPSPLCDLHSLPHHYLQQDYYCHIFIPFSCIALVNPRDLHCDLPRTARVRLARADRGASGGGVLELGAAGKAEVERARGRGYGNFDIIRDRLPRIFELHNTPHAPRAAICLVPCLSCADWCLQSDVVTNSGLQAGGPGVGQVSEAVFDHR